jgi:Fe-Mn family superoxide dismutase
MAFELPALPYSKDALLPQMSPETLEIHHGKHHKAYVDNLNKLVPGTEFENMTLEQIIMKSNGGTFNNAAQVWNHTFFWNCMKPKGGGEPSGDLLAQINSSFGSFNDFKTKFADTSVKQFGSGWGWLVKSKAGKLEIVSTSNAANPMTDGHQPLLTCDVWEHAYYIDYRNRRADFLTAFWNLVNWDFVAQNLAKAK